MFQKHKWGKIIILCVCAVCLFLLIYTRPVRFSELTRGNEVTKVQLTLEDLDSDKTLADLQITDAKTCNEFMQIFDRFTFQEEIPWRKILLAGVPGYSDVHAQVTILISFKTPQNNWESLFLQMFDNPHGIHLDKLAPAPKKNSTDLSYRVGNWWKADETELYREIISFIGAHE